MASMLLLGFVLLKVKFFWGGGGSLGIRNLALAKHSLTAKIIFKYLDIDDAIWDRPCSF